MALTAEDKAEIQGMVWDMLASCGLAETLDANADPMIKTLFQSRVLPYLKGRLSRTSAMGYVTPEDVAFIKDKLGDGE